ncbi:MAG: hypothetical protein PVH19_09920, partial [Planctomycetia bacterium]
CKNNLRQIGIATHVYRDLTVTRRRPFPTRDVTGYWVFRVAPGKICDGLDIDYKCKETPRSLPETYGLQSLYDRLGILKSGGGGVWTCPNAPDFMREYGNTYAHSIAKSLASPDQESEKRRLWVWDNFTALPAVSGIPMRPTSCTIPSEKRQYSHGANGFSGKGYNVLFQDGHVEFFEIGKVDFDKIEIDEDDIPEEVDDF